MKTGTKIAIGIGGLVLVGGLIFLMTRKKDESLADSGPVEGQPDRPENENPVEVDPVASEYGGRTIFDSGEMYPKMPQVKQPDIFKINQVVENKDENKDWTQDPYYYYF
jgi:hypothetical protein